MIADRLFDHAFFLVSVGQNLINLGGADWTRVIAHVGDTGIDHRLRRDRIIAQHVDQIVAKQHGIEIFSGSGLGKVQTQLFEELVEKKLKQPTFITEFPTEVSPLSRPNDKNPFVACADMGEGKNNKQEHATSINA